MVAAEQPLASLAGYNVLRKGGNSFDAAIATSVALAVTFHPAGGIGGDFFGLFYEMKSGTVSCLNGSGWSPSGLTSDLINSKEGGKIPKFGPLSCVVPGYIGGIWELHHKLGTMEFKELLKPSVELAIKGFPAGEGLCRAVAGAYQDLSREVKEIFAPGGRVTRPGEWIRQEALGRVLSEVAEGGPQAFYSGWPAEKAISTLDLLGQAIKADDFSSYMPEWVQPLSLDYRDSIVYEMPPNSMGATNLLILRTLAQTDLAKFGPLSKGRIRQTMRAAVPAYARRDEMLGDPKFSHIDMDAFLSVRKKPVAARGRMMDGDTTAFSIVDSEGNIVSGIQSLFQQFGSRVFVPECGIILNNRASGFSMTGPNKVEPRKRPLHTLSSMMLERDGRPYLAIGTSGGNYRPLLHTQFVTNSVDYSMPAEDNVAHPRFLWDGDRGILVEGGYEIPIDKSFDIQRHPMPGGMGRCQAVEISGRYKKGICDARGEGIPAGY